MPFLAVRIQISAKSSAHLSNEPYQAHFKPQICYRYYQKQIPSDEVKISSDEVKISKFEKNVVLGVMTSLNTQIDQKWSNSIKFASPFWTFRMQISSKFSTQLSKDHLVSLH
jgi:hypothetical protein